MKNIREVLRLKFQTKCSNATIARAVEIGETTVREYLKRAQNAGISWPIPEELCDKRLEERLYPFTLGKIRDHYDPIDFEHVHKELAKKGVTLSLLWEEYKGSNSNYCCYSQFCHLYQEWRSCGECWMMQSHKAGENTFIDWAGPTIPIYNSSDGTVAFEAQVFVAALGASSYIFAEARKSQQQEEWLDSHKHMGEFYGGVSECWVPDNTKTAVIRSNRYEPRLSASYNAMAQHYNVAILPARVREPQDKSKVESAVYLVETHILAPLRNLKFFNLDEVNLAIKEKLRAINEKPFQKMQAYSRYSLYLEIDKPALKPLPNEPYEMFRFGRERINRGYHVIIAGVPYSVPYKFVGKSVEYRYNERIVEFFHNSKQIAIHIKSSKGVATNRDHMPPKHRHHVDCTPENIRSRAKAIGPAVFAWVASVLENTSVNERQRINTALGVVRLTKLYPPERLNAACARGLSYKNFLYKGIEEMLKRDLDKLPLAQSEDLNRLPQDHLNIRGSEYFHAQAQQKALTCIQ